MSNDFRFSSDELLKVLSLSPNATAIYTGRQLIIQTANKAMLQFWGRDATVIGQPLEEAVPELKGQPFTGILQDVLNTGTVYEATDAKASLLVDGQLQTFYFDFIYRPVKDEQGKTYCILHTATDVTERYINRRELLIARQTEEALDRERALNEELAAINEELTTTNEQLKDGRHKLQLLNSKLENRVADRTRALAASEANFRNRVMQAPVAIALFTGSEMVLDLVNDRFLQMWDREASVIGKPVLEILPEIEGQPFIILM